MLYGHDCDEDDDDDDYDQRLKYGSGPFALTSNSGL